MPNAYAGSDNYPTTISVVDDGDDPSAANLAPAAEGNRDAIVYLKNRIIIGDSINTIFDEPGGSAETASQLFLPGASDSGRVIVPFTGPGDFVLELGDVDTTDAYIVDVDGTVILDPGDIGYLVVVATFDGTPQDVRVKHFKNNDGTAQHYDNFHIHVPALAVAAEGTATIHLEMRHTAGGSSAFGLLGQLSMSAIHIKVT